MVVAEVTWIPVACAVFSALAPFIVVIGGVLLKTVAFANADLVEQDDAIMEAPLDLGLLSISLMFATPASTQAALSAEGRNVLILTCGILVIVFFVASQSALRKARRVYSESFSQLGKAQQKAQERTFKLTGTALQRWNEQRSRMWWYYAANCLVIVIMAVPIVMVRFKEEQNHQKSHLSVQGPGTIPERENNDGH